MDMKKISLAVIVIAALLSVVLAADLPKDPLAAANAAAAAVGATPKASATAPSGSSATTTSSAASPTPSSTTGTSAPAPSPSGAPSTMPAVGSFAGVFLMAFFGYYLQ